MFAEGMTALSASGTAKARAAAQAALEAGKDVADLTAGEIWCEPPTVLRAGAIAAINRGISRYTDTVGIEALRRAIAGMVSKETGQTWNIDEIAVTAGGKQALFNAAMAILNPGDEVIIPIPYWTTFPAQVALAGARPVFVDTRANGYVPRPEDLEKAATPATRAIVVNTPNNPTGAVYSPTLLKNIADFAMAHDLWVISDECYGAFTFEPHHHHSIVSVAPEVRSRTLVVNAFSKQYAITGWRLGYLAAPPAVIAAVKSLQSHTTSAPNVIAQHAALSLLDNGDDGFREQMRARLGAARKLCQEAFSRVNGVPVPAMQGGFYAYLDLTDVLAEPSARTAEGPAIVDADDIAVLLLEKACVAVVSGRVFGDPVGLRLSYGVPIETLKGGLERLATTVNTLSAKRQLAQHQSAI